MPQAQDHPCFGENARNRFGRVHLPVAPKNHLRCLFCPPSPGPAGHSDGHLSPRQALSLLEKIVQAGRDLDVVGVTGPGDPMATPEATLETFRLVRERFPDVTLALCDHGLNLTSNAVALAEAGVNHVTLMVFGVDEEHVARAYGWVRPGVRTLSREEGARLLVDAQAEAVAALKKAGLTVKINTIVVPGLNEHHVGEIARVMAGLGADLMAVSGYRPEPGSDTGTPAAIPAPTEEQLDAARAAAAEHLPLAPAADRCRADMAGKPGDESAEDIVQAMMAKAGAAGGPTPERPYVAVATTDGASVDEHLGKARKLLLYGEEGGMGRMVGVREAPAPGGGANRWQTLAETLSDCFAILVADAGENPRNVLAAQGVQVLQKPGFIEDMVADALGVQRKKR